MDAQQLYDYIIKPTHEYMGGNYASKEANFLSLCTAAIESDCGHYVKQIGGPALGFWQMEPDTHNDIWDNCDAVCGVNYSVETRVNNLMGGFAFDSKTLIQQPMYACAMARLKYSMDPQPLPKLSGDRLVDSNNFYNYYKRVYNTYLGASTKEKWDRALVKHRIFEVKL